MIGGLGSSDRKGSMFETLLQPYERAEFDERFWNQRPAMLRPGPEIRSTLADARMLDPVALCDAGHQDFKIMIGEQPSFGDADDAQKAWAEEPNTTLVAQNAQFTIPALAHYSVGLLQSLGVPVRLTWPNIYYSRPEAGFGRHWDNHENFILGLAGTKTFSVAPNRLVPYPSANAYAGSISAPELADSIERELTATRLEGAVDYTVGENDCLFIPRGWWHEAFASGGPSVTLTYAVWTATWEDVLRACGKMTSHKAPDVLLRTPAPLMRREVPHGLGGHDVAPADGPRLLAMAELKGVADILRDWRYGFERGPAPTRVD